MQDVDPGAAEVLLADGGNVSYDKLVVATGPSMAEQPPLRDAGAEH